MLCLLEPYFWQWHFIVTPTPLFLRKKKSYMGSGALNHFIPLGLITSSFLASSKPSLPFIRIYSLLLSLLKTEFVEFNELNTQ